MSIHGLRYWADAFRDPEVERTAVPVRSNPYDAGLAYAFVRGRWVRCLSEQYARFAGRSEREIALVTQELRRRHPQHLGQRAVSARHLADFLVSLEAEETLVQQRLHDAETRAVLDQMAGGASPSVVTLPSPVAGPPAPAAALVVYEDF